MSRSLASSRITFLVIGALLLVGTTAAVLATTGTGELLDSSAPAPTTAALDSTTSTVAPPLFAKVAAPAPPRTEPPPATEPPPPPPTTAAPAPPTRPAPEPAAEPEPAPAAAPATEGPRCIVRLHGKGGGAGGTRQAGDGLVEVAPSGNAAAWGGREWRYFPASGYNEARGIVQQAIDNAGCGPVVVYGFSNGGAFAAKLYCKGETFGGRVRGVVIDDPVTDHAVAGCRPAGGVRVVLYWTGALESSGPGWDCASGDWTCEGGTTIGIDAYQGALGISRKPSPNGSHAPYSNAPELNAWW